MKILLKRLFTIRKNMVARSETNGFGLIFAYATNRPCNARSVRSGFPFLRIPLVRVVCVALIICFTALLSTPLRSQPLPDTPDGTGTGFFVTDDSIAVTNFHVVQKYESNNNRIIL
jgi:hypothetical protein